MVFTEKSKNKRRVKHKKLNILSELNEYKSKDNKKTDVQSHILEDYKIFEHEINSRNKHEENSMMLKFASLIVLKNLIKKVRNIQIQKKLRDPIFLKNQ